MGRERISGNLSGEIMSTPVRTFFEKVSRSLPEIKKPGRKVSLGEKLMWTALALVIYLWMGDTILYGIPSTAVVGQTPLLLNIIFAANQGTLTTLGIGPIVTAGLILQLLVGAEIIKLDLSKPEDRGLFTSASKMLAIVVTVFEAVAFTFGGFFGPLNQNQALLVLVQLVAATVVIIMLDEMVQKGWGLGSGISLFIAAGVAQQIFLSLFSPITLDDGFFQGIILALAQGFAVGNLTPLIIRGFFPDVVGLVATVTLILILIYLESVRIEIPISYARFSGYRAKYPIKLLYVSNIPIIFASTIFSNIYYIGSIIWSRFNPNNDNLLLNLIGTFQLPEGGGQPIPTGGLAYYTLGPRNLIDVSADPVRAVLYALLLTVFAVLFAKFWVQIGGLSPEKVAKQLINAGMQIPGFRRSPTVIANVIRKYISAVTILGGIIIGLVGSVADYFNVFGSGIGILLMVGILYQYYQLLVRERVSEMYPALGRLLGEE